MSLSLSPGAPQVARATLSARAGALGVHVLSGWSTPTAAATVTPPRGRAAMDGAMDDADRRRWTPFDLDGMPHQEHSRAKAEAKVRAVAYTNRVTAIARMRLRQWGTPCGFVDVFKTGDRAASARPLGEFHGDPVTGPRGHHRTTLEVLVFCNEVLCHPEKEHLPDVFFRFARWGSFNTLRCMDRDRVDVVVAAKAFARLRRAWPTAVYADRVGVFESELPWLLAPADESSILSVQMLLSQHADDPQTEDAEAWFNWEEFVCQGEGHLVPSTAPPGRAVQEATCQVARQGFICPPWASSFFKDASPETMRRWLPEVPDIFRELPFSLAPTWPLVVTYFRGALVARKRPLRHTLLAELVAKVAATWFAELRVRQLMYRLPGELPHLITRIPLNVLGTGVADPSWPLCFAAARQGLPLVPWEEVHQADVTNRFPDGSVAAIRVAYAPEMVYAFELLHPAGDFPAVSRRTPESPLRAPPSPGASGVPPRAFSASAPGSPAERTSPPPSPDGGSPAARSQRSAAQSASHRVPPTTKTPSTPSHPVDSRAPASPSADAPAAVVPLSEDEALWGVLDAAQEPPREPLASTARVVAAVRAIRQEESAAWAARTAPPETLALALAHMRCRDATVFRRALRDMQGATLQVAYETLLDAVRTTFGPQVGRQALDAEVERLCTGQMGTPGGGASGPRMSTTTERGRARSSGGRGASRDEERPSQRRRRE